MVNEQVNGQWCSTKVSKKPINLLREIEKIAGKKCVGKEK